MCGIAGLVGVHEAVAFPRVTEALRRLAHRGPDGDGMHRAEGGIIGMRRLAIIDLVTGDQPIYNEDKRVVVVCNGELYNYVELFPELLARGHRFQSKSDINIVPHLYEEDGREAFARMRGMFAIALWDESRRRLVLARDRAGKKPLFYARVGAGLAFASELPALLALLDRTPAHNPTAVADYLRLGFIPHPETIYQDVHVVPPGASLVFAEGGEPDIAPYWTPTTPAPFSGSRADAVAELDRRVREAVTIRLRSDVPVGLFLSGGIDSGLVGSYAAEAGANDLLCFVVEVADQVLNEAPAARRTAAHIGLPIETVTLAMSPHDMVQRIPLLYGQPFGDPSAIPSFLVAQAARRHRKVVLNGDGGDEVFAGYRRYWAGRVAPWAMPLATILGPALRWLGATWAARAERRTGGGFVARALRGVGTSPEDRYLIWTCDIMRDRQVARCFPELASRGSTVPRLEAVRGELTTPDGLHEFQRSDFRLILADGLLPKMDIATMANSLEARSPFLDIPLVEFAWSLPERWLINAAETKPLLRELARTRLPAEITSAPKRGFEIPVRRWVENELRDLVQDLVLGADSRVAAFGDAAEVRRFVRSPQGFDGNHPMAVWSLLVLELFLRAPTPGPSGSRDVRGSTSKPRAV